MAVPNIPTTGPIILHDTEPEIDGILYPKFMQEKVLRRIKDIEVREDDVWLLSYPKTGTHWMKGVLYQIFNHDTPEGSGDKEAMSPDDFVPFLEFPDFKKPGNMSIDNIIAIPPSQKRFIATHLQPGPLPTQYFEKKPKTIHIVRNPKDTAVSYFHFAQKNPCHTKPNDWESYLDDYITGSLPYGSQADYVTLWWNKRNESNQLFVTFEEMKKDLSAGVKKIAHFLGKDVTDEVAETIADRCSFSSMKVKAVAAPKKESGASGPIMYRKGIAGGWKKTFTVAQSERFDSFFNEKFANIDINIEYE